MIKFMKRCNFAPIRQICIGIAVSTAAFGSIAAGPITLECQALVVKRISDVREFAHLENFSLTIQSEMELSKVAITGDTSIQLDIDEINQTAKSDNDAQQTVHLSETTLHAEKVIKKSVIAQMRVLRIDIPTGKLRFHEWTSPDVSLVAEGRCK